MTSRTRAALAAASALIACGDCAAAERAPVERGWAHTYGIAELGKPIPTARAGDPTDRLMIQETFARWGIAWDDERLDVIEDLFVEDGKFRVVMGNAKPLGECIGRASIMQSCVRHALTQQTNGQRRHLVTNVVIDHIDGRTARALAYSLVILHGGTPAIDGTVIYTADLRRGQDGVWRFASLTIGLDAYGGDPPKALPK